MNIITKEEFYLKQHIYLKELSEGKIFVHPTDTIYGLGAIASNDDSVKKIRELKKSKHPFSIIVPDEDWIRKNCFVNEEVMEWLKKLPGPFTFILNLRNKNAVSKYVNCDLDTIGIRIPNHWIFRIVKNLEEPLVSTAATSKDGIIIEDPDDVDPEFENSVDFFINDSIMLKKPSIVIDLTKETPAIIRK